MYERLAVYIRDNKYSGHCEDILEQLKHVEQPWTKVARLVTAYEQCLDDVTTSPKSDKVQLQLRLALKDLSKGVNQVRSEVSYILETIAGLMHADTQQVRQSISKTTTKFTREARDAVHMKSQSLYLAFEKLCISEHQEGSSKALDLQPTDEKHDDMHKTRPPNKESPDSASTGFTADSSAIRTFEIPEIAGFNTYTSTFDHLSVEEKHQSDLEILAASNSTWHCGFCDTYNPVSKAICTVCEGARDDYMISCHGGDQCPVQTWCCDECGYSNPFWLAFCPLCAAVRSKEHSRKFFHERARRTDKVTWICETCGYPMFSQFGISTCCESCGEISICEDKERLS